MTVQDIATIEPLEGVEAWVLVEVPKHGNVDVLSMLNHTEQKGVEWWKLRFL